MAKDVAPARGMRDFLPAEKAKRERLLGAIREVYTRHGFEEIETPVVENFDVLHSGLGGDNEKLAFNVLKRGLDHDDLSAAAQHGEVQALADLGLRYDLTVPLARFYATHRSELPGVFRALQIAPVWRAERPQKGRFRQFVQCDIDIIGESGQLAEVELISATVDVLDTLGLTGCTIRVNDRRILAGILDFCGFAPERYPQALISIDKLDKIGVDGVIAELSETGADSAAVLGGLLERFAPHVADGGVPLTTADIVAVLPDGIDPDAVAALESLANALQGSSSAVSLRFDPTLVRGMGYYTGTIFEIAHPQSGSSVGGGGRYDGMIGRFLGQDVPAAGFSIGFERIVDLVDWHPHTANSAQVTHSARDAATSQATSAQAAIVLVHDAILDEADLSAQTLLALKAELIASGARVRLEKRVKNLAPVLDRAKAAGFSSFASVSAETKHVADLQFKDLA